MTAEESTSLNQNLIKMDIIANNHNLKDVEPRKLKFGIQDFLINRADRVEFRNNLPAGKIYSL